MEEVLNCLKLAEEAHKKFDIVSARQHYQNLKVALASISNGFSQFRFPLSRLLDDFFLIVPELQEGATTWGARATSFIQIFDTIIQRHAKRDTTADPSQVAAFMRGPKIYLEDLTKTEADCASYLEPKGNQKYLLAQMCFICAVKALEQKSFSRNLFSSVSYLLIY